MFKKLAMVATATATTLGAVFYHRSEKVRAETSPIAPPMVPPEAAASPEIPGSTEASTSFVDIPVSRRPVNQKLTPVKAPMTFAPQVPPPVDRDYAVRLQIDIQSTVNIRPLTNRHKFAFWGFNNHTPGPFIRARVGDVLEVNHTNEDDSGMAHNIDFHAVTGPGGGAEATLAEQGETKTAYFKLLHPGLFFYHCAAAPVPMHIANGMYGLLLVEPEGGLPPVDREFYVMQSEFYTEPSTDDPKFLEATYIEGLHENPQHVVFNGREGALTDNPLQVKTGERVRIYFGNAGPNLDSSFHIIGTIFDKVYREGDLISPPARSIQTTLVPAGGTTVVELEATVPGNFTLIDHSIFRLDKGAVGFLKVAGPERPDIYEVVDRPRQCQGCKLHN